MIGTKSVVKPALLMATRPMHTETRSQPAPLDPAHGSRREAILAAALKLFSEHGVHTVSTRQIAARVGISQPSLYAHFPTKLALAAAVCMRAFEDLAARMAVALEAMRQGRADMTAMARVYVEFGLTQPDAYRLAFMIEQTDLVAPGDEDPMLGAGLRAFSVCRDGVALSVGSDLSEADIDTLAQSVWAALHGLVSLLIARPAFPWVDRETLIERHIAREFATFRRH